MDMNTLIDRGQNSYKLLSVHKNEFIQAQKEIYNCEDNLDVILHRIVKRLLKTHEPEKYSWLRENRASTTYEVFHYYNEVEIYVGFIPGDPIETMFILRWS